jgi:hypothetical protein
MGSWTYQHQVCVAHSVLNNVCLYCKYPVFSVEPPAHTSAGRVGLETFFECPTDLEMSAGK